LIITMHGGEKLSLDNIRELMSASEDLGSGANPPSLWDALDSGTN